MGMDEYWYSIKKQIDGLNLGKMRHSFHSVVLFDHIFQISCIWGHLLFDVEEGSCVSLGCWSITHPSTRNGGAMDGQLLQTKIRALQSIT